MIEESLENFITQYKPYAVNAELLGHTEGSPLIECVVQDKVLHFLERTGPYLSTPGKHNVILNPVIKTYSEATEPTKHFESNAISQLKATGLVLENQDKSLIVDVGVNIVLSSAEGFEGVATGDWISFESLAPIHGFVLPKLPSKNQQRSDEDSI